MVHLPLPPAGPAGTARVMPSTWCDTAWTIHSEATLRVGEGGQGRPPNFEQPWCWRLSHRHRERLGVTELTEGQMKAAHTRARMLTHMCTLTVSGTVQETSSPRVSLKCVARRQALAQVNTQPRTAGSRAVTLSPAPTRRRSDLLPVPEAPAVLADGPGRSLIAR